MNERKFRKWCEKNLKSEDEKERKLIIHEKLEKEYRGIKYFLLVVENHYGDTWVVLERDNTQFQEWEINLIEALRDHFDFYRNFLWFDSKCSQTHKSIEDQKKFLEEISKDQVDFLYNLCNKGLELVKKKKDYFTQVLRWMENYCNKPGG